MSCQIVRAAERHYQRSVTLEEACRFAWDNIRMAVKGDSWRVYVSKHIASLSTEDEREECRKIYRELRGSSPPIRRKRRPGRRKKGLSYAEYEALMNELKSPRVGDEAGLRSARIWLAATYHTGLRPSEWAGSSVVIIEGHEYLKCRNAKVVVWDFGASGMAKQGRIKAHYRIIPIGYLPDNIRAVIGAQVHAAAALAELQEDGYSRVYDRIRQLIARAARNLWPAADKRPTLYSARHAFRDSFEARLLADGATTTEAELLVSVVMGHGSRETKYVYGVGDDAPLIAERKTAVDALMKQRNVLISWAVSQIE